jgi:hypothetical protein
MPINKVIDFCFVFKTIKKIKPKHLKQTINFSKTTKNIIKIKKNIFNEI